MERANRVAISTTEHGYEARFYRTHKLVMIVAQTGVGWEADEQANSTTNRESFRQWVCDHAEEYGVEWNPTKVKQAWERKHNIYMTDAEVAEDAITLVSPVIERLAEKGRYSMVVNGIEVVAVTPKESKFSYVEDGRYTKSGAWCVADIDLELDVLVGEHSMRMPFAMEIKSGQICKPKTTIAEWNEIVTVELELNGITIKEESNVA